MLKNFIKEKILRKKGNEDNKIDTEIKKKLKWGVIGLVGGFIPILLVICLVASTLSMVNTSILNGLMLTILNKEKKDTNGDGKIDERDGWGNRWGDSWDDDTEIVNGDGTDGENVTLKPGVYPSDPQLKVKAQLVELANEIGARGEIKLDPRLIFAIWYVEWSCGYTYDKNAPNVYTDLACISSFKQYFTNGDVYNGKVNDSMGIGVGPFQFYSTWMDPNLQYMYTPAQAGGPKPQKVAPHMSVMDTQLGFKRPHPLYMPDAMYSMAAKIREHMYGHEKYAEKNEGFSKLSSDAQQVILFAYACDAYQGETIGRSSKLHELIGQLYIDIYNEYGKFDICKGSGAGGKGRNAVIGPSYDGVINSPIKVNGVTFNETLLQKYDKKYNRGYVNALNSVGTNVGFRMSITYAFEGIQGGYYTYDLWSKQVADALAKEGKGGSGGNGGSSIEGGIPGAVLPVNPINGVKLQISSQFGWRATETVNLHTALDISSAGSSNRNVPIYSALPGKVVQIGHNSPPFTGYGNAVRVRTEYNGRVFVYEYNHMDTITVGLGQQVTAGTQVGTMGSTGGDMPIHLDWEFEVHEAGNSGISDGVKAHRNKQNPLIPFGFNPSWDRNTRNKWLDANNMTVQCNSTCYGNELLDNIRDGYATFNCKNHRSLSSKYPK